MSHNRTLTSRDGFSFSKDGDGKPSIVRVVLPGQGEFTVQLTTVDNENNKLIEKYFLIVSDPVASIKQQPEV